MAQIQGRVEYIEYEMTKRTAGKTSSSFFPLVDDALNGILLAIPSIFSRALVVLLVLTALSPAVIASVWVTGAVNELSLYGVFVLSAISVMMFFMVALQLFIGHYVYTIHAQIRSGPDSGTIEL